MSNTDQMTSTKTRTVSRFTRFLRAVVAVYVAQYEIPGVDPSARLRHTPIF
jgi:hypothetical protein